MSVSNSRDTILIERRYAAVFSTLTDDSIVKLAGAVEEKLRDALAKVLALPAAHLPSQPRSHQRFVRQ